MTPPSRGARKPRGAALRPLAARRIEGDDGKSVLDAFSKDNVNREESEFLNQVLERGFERGRKQGLEQGLEQGLKQGLERGLERGRRREAQTQLRQLERRLGVPVVVRA